MGRRKSDRFQYRLLILSACLSGALAVLASVVSYKAIHALNIFTEAIEATIERRSFKRI